MVVFIPYRVGLKDEHPTSNVQRRTSNNDVAPLRNLISFVYYFCFFSAVSQSVLLDMWETECDAFAPKASKRHIRCFYSGLQSLSVSSGHFFDLSQIFHTKKL